jgi:hypothetical protein
LLAIGVDFLQHLVDAELEGLRETAPASPDPTAERRHKGPDHFLSRILSGTTAVRHRRWWPARQEPEQRTRTMAAAPAK